jgi:hypothetical protein
MQAYYFWDTIPGTQAQRKKLYLSYICPVYYVFFNV